MDKELCKMTVFFDEPFWIGIFERYVDRKLSVAKVTFGADPKDYDIYQFVLKKYYDLQFSSAVEAVVKEIKKNPKRKKRDVKKQMQVTGIGTKSQQALKLQQEKNKKQRKEKSREEKMAETERMFELKQQKKKEKHRGH